MGYYRPGKYRLGRNNYWCQQRAGKTERGPPEKHLVLRSRHGGRARYHPEAQTQPAPGPGPLVSGAGQAGPGINRFFPSLPF